jgi:NAD(P)H-flavin reductase
MFSKYLPPPNDDTLILLCGPKGMDATATELLNNLGYRNEIIHRF